MPVFKIKSICVKLEENEKFIEVLDKKTGVIDKVYKSRNELKYQYYLKKDYMFYTLKMVEE